MNDVATQQQWVAHLVATFGKAARGGVRYYGTDNEVSIAHGTHADIQPAGMHADIFRDKVLAYSAMVKAADRKALVVGPEEWGPLALLYSGYDQQTGGKTDHDGLQAGMDYIPWLLKEWKKTGRPVDVFSTHYYPQRGEFSDDVSPAMQAMRNRSTRELWDPAYQSESWLGDVFGVVKFIPRLKQALAKHYYKDTPIALTEYNWGAENHINGATAQADLLGIFGREGVSIATRWETPARDTPTFKAMQLYRNYDGQNSGFGDTSLPAKVPDPDVLAAFAARRSSDDALTVMLINKVPEENEVRLDLSGAKAGKVRLYQLTAENRIRKLPVESYDGGKFAITVPPQSITLCVLSER
jgi:hypothetical protein